MMTHYQDSELTDYVRGLVPEHVAANMAAHLGECERCAALARTFGRLAHTAAADRETSPPDHLVRAARAITALQPPTRVQILPRLRARLVFDSFSTPLPAGMRSGQSMSRQVLYEAGPYAIDLRLDHERGARRVCLIGQVATPAGGSVDQLGVTLSTAAGPIGQVVTNVAGEFQFEYEPGPPLQLRIVHPDVQIELPVEATPEQSADDGRR